MCTDEGDFFSSEDNGEQKEAIDNDAENEDDDGCQSEDSNTSE